MDTEEIIRLIQTVSASHLTEFEYRQGDTRIAMKTGIPAETSGAVAASVMVAAESAEADHEGIWIKSPMVGTFYRAASEDAEPYVKVGDRVQKGQVLGIIETMKLMNELESDQDGVIAEILIENEQVVEYGQRLFRIEG